MSEPWAEKTCSAGTFGRVVPEAVLTIYACVIAAGLTGAVGLSWIYVALYWPSHVLADFAAGSGWVVTCWAIFEWLNIPADPHRGGTGIQFG